MINQVGLKFEKRSMTSSEKNYLPHIEPDCVVPEKVKIMKWQVAKFLRGSCARN